MQMNHLNKVIWAEYISSHLH